MTFLRKINSFYNHASKVCNVKLEKLYESMESQITLCDFVNKEGKKVTDDLEIIKIGTNLLKLLKNKGFDEFRINYCPRFKEFKIFFRLNIEKWLKEWNNKNFTQNRLKALKKC